MATSTISNTIKDLNGDPVEGVVVIVRLLPGTGFRIAEGTEIAPQDTTVTDSNGLWSIALEQQANITPADTGYEVEEQIPDAKGGPKFHSIQVGSSSATLKASLVSPLPDAGGPTYLTQEAADARYQALGSFAGSPRVVRSTANATAGVATSAVRSDEVPSLHDELAGDGLAISGGILAVNPDGSTLEISSDAVRQKDDGTTLAKLSPQARGLLHHALYLQGVT